VQKGEVQKVKCRKGTRPDPNTLWAPSDPERIYWATSSGALVTNF
jgi:hypothetical protein